MYGSLDISVSGMIAQRIRMDTIAANLANRDTVADSQGRAGPFRRKIAAFVAGDPNGRTQASRELGVHIGAIAEDQAPFRKVYEPTSPFARPAGDPDEGYVDYPNIDPVLEQVNAVEAMRSYEANAAAAEATKTMLAQALRLIA